MKKFKRTGKDYLLIAIVGMVFAQHSFAAVSAEEAKALGTTLTPWGAEKAGNKDGTIPPYTGEGIKAPASYDRKNKPSERPDPFRGEKPLFSITAQNAGQYADKLDGMLEVFKKYPNYRMDIYPTHRTVFFPKWVVDNTIKNAVSCKAAENGLVLQDCYGGMVFPIPKTGNEVMWNHLTFFDSEAWAGLVSGYIVANNGSVTRANTEWNAQQSWFYDPTRTTPARPDTVYWSVRIEFTDPPRKVGEKILILDALDNLHVGRRAWQYIPGQRRVKLAPDLNYDTPSPTSGGLMTIDDGKIFLGPLDRYDWKFIGKKEKFIPYNNFKLSAEHASCTTKQVLTKSFPNPDCFRWELHRVLAVEGTLKKGFRHIYPKRYAYWDEDGFGSGMTESYDAGGGLYRVNLGTGFPYYVEEGGGLYMDINVVLDLVQGAYIANSSFDPGEGMYAVPPAPLRSFSPEAIAGEGVR